MFLRTIGYSDYFEAHFSALASPRLVPGRVFRSDGNECRVLDPDGREQVLAIPHASRGEARPVAGDFVAYEPTRPVVVAVLPRRTAFVRRKVGKGEERQVVAANADVLGVVMGLDTDFNPRRLSRYLTLAHSSGARPVVLLTKVGRVHEPLARERTERVRHAAPGLDVFAVDVPASIGLQSLDGLVGPGTTLALIGSSGVGKSTLVNHWKRANGDGSRELVATSPTRAFDGKGRHTTTHRELHVLPGGGAILDTPGMRELGLTGHDLESIDRTFEAVAELARECRFRDCRHDREPGCALREAVRETRLSAAQIDEYLGLRNESERSSTRAEDRRVRERRMGKLRIELRKHTKR